MGADVYVAEDHYGDEIRVYTRDVSVEREDLDLWIRTPEGREVGVNARALRDALSVHLGEAGCYTASALVEAKALGYSQGIETGRLVERGSMSVGNAQHVSAVEVEIFREAYAARMAETWDLHEDAQDLSATRTALEAVENYRAWKGQSK